MPAMGATFAVLMALTLASEAGHFRSAQDLVSNEAAQASRLAWAATSPGVETAPVQAALVHYLGATRLNEWHLDRSRVRRMPGLGSSATAPGITSSLAAHPGDRSRHS